MIEEAIYIALIKALRTTCLILAAAIVFLAYGCGSEIDPFQEKDPGIFRVWENDAGGSLDLSYAQFGSTSMSWHLEGGIICFSDITIEGDQSQGTASVTRMIGVEECDSYNQDYTYELMNNILTVCGDGGCVDYFEET